MGYSSPGENSTLEADDASRTPKMVFFVIIMLTSVVGSISVIIGLVHQLKLRTPQNVFIVNICALCVLDCTLNMAIVLGALAMRDWIYGDFMCKVNNFFLNAVSVATALMLTALSVDRYLSLRFNPKYETWLSSHRLYAVITYLWLHAIIFSSPFLTDSASSVYRLKLYLCTITSETSTAFIYATLALCYLVPFIIIVVFHVLTFRLSCELSYTPCEGEAPSLNSTESQRTAFIICLTAMWLILEAPYITITHIRYDNQLVNVSEPGYPWELGVTFIWMRFAFSALFPIVTLIFKKDIWRCVRERLTCRRNNAIVDMNVTVLSSAVNLQKETPERKTTPKKPKAKDKEGSSTSSKPTFKVPVLFATSTGICIEDPSNDCPFDTFKLNSDYEKFERKCKTLDITYTDYEYDCELFGDTSDYDSSCEIDPYSSSQPVSSRHIQGAFHRTRSMSDPEFNVRLSHDKATRHEKKKDLSGTIGADSGLDLSAATAPSLGSANSRISGDSRKSLINRGHSASKTFGEAELDNILCEQGSRNVHIITNKGNQTDHSVNATASVSYRGVKNSSIVSVGQGSRQYDEASPSVRQGSRQYDEASPPVRQRSRQCNEVSPPLGQVSPPVGQVSPPVVQVSTNDELLTPHDGQEATCNGELRLATVIRVRSSPGEMANTEDILNNPQ